MAALTTKRDEDSLELAPKRTPLFRDYGKQHFSCLDTVKDAKSPKTVQLEKDFVRQWHLRDMHERRAPYGRRKQRLKHG